MDGIRFFMMRFRRFGEIDSNKFRRMSCNFTKMRV